MGARPKAQIVLNEAEQEQLLAWARRRKTAQALAGRAGVRRGHGEQSGGGPSARDATDGLQVA